MCTFKKILFSGIAIVLLIMAQGCIKNDLPYPHIQVNFTDFLVEGQQKAAEINAEQMVVNLTLGEEVDITRVKVLNFEIEPAEGRVAEGALPEVVDLSKPKYVTLSLYQEYVWTICATQPIERYFSVESQMGEPVIDVPGKRVIAYVPKGTSLKSLTVTAIKLGSTASKITPDLTAQEVDFTQPVEVTVTDYGRDAVWTIYVEEVDATVALTQVDAWSRVAWFYANGRDGRDNGFEYRVKGTEDWTRVPSEYVTAAGGTFSARLVHLSPETDYEVRAFSDTDVTSAHSFTTGAEPQMPNSDFNQWWLDGKVWNPWAEGGSSYWDTGNKGSTTLGTSNSFPTDDTPTGTGYSAELRSEFKGVGALGKLAAGSIFTGVYVRTDGTNGILSLGRDFTERPTRLTGMLRYHSAPISHIGSDAEFADWKGRPDTASVYVALIDTDTPFEIRTNPKNRRLLDPNSSIVVAYGIVKYGENVASWTPFSVDLEYRSTSRVPKYIIVVASASMYGDYFVGGDGSVLKIDELQLEYDY